MNKKDDLAIDNELMLCYVYNIVSAALLVSGGFNERENRLKKFSAQFEDIVGWATKYNVDIELGPGFEDRYEPSEKAIYINSRLGPESRYYTLLHECGHLLIDNHWRDFDRDNPMYASSCDKRVAKSKAYRVSIVAEEIEAWKRGRRLANRLGHFIDDEKFDKAISENVMTYIDWASTGGGEI